MSGQETGAGGGIVDDLDDDTVRAVESGRATLGAMLSTAQSHLRRVFIVFLVGMLGGIYAMRLVVWPQLEEDLLVAGADVVALTPFDVILLQVKIGLIVGVLVSIPALAYYARDPLAERGVINDVPLSRWKVAVVVVLSVLLFLGGATYAYYLFFPIMFGFLATNAMGAGFAPLYSIVAWTQFILVLGLSFGFAAQLPLVMSALSYSGIVPYEAFRDNWKYAVVGMFGFGALFSPPDPFTQIMWAAPLVALYWFSLYVSKIIVTAKRGSEALDILGTLRDRWTRIAAGSLVVAGVAYAFLAANVARSFEPYLARLPAAIRPGPLPTTAEVVGIPHPWATVVVAGVVGAVALVALLGHYVYASVEAAAAAAGDGRPAAIDLDRLDAEGIRAAPPEAFASLSEEEALALANEAVEADDREKAAAILDRYDEAEAAREADADEEGVPAGDAGTGDAADDGEEYDSVTRTTAGMMNAFTEDETTEEDIGGYYYDLKFVFDSLRSRLFRIFVTFIAVLAGTFWFLYSGGIGTIREDFLTRMPETVPAEQMSGDWPVTLHPVEALVFEVKISVVFAIIVTIPLVLYYAWPALKDRGLAHGRRDTLLVWGGSLLVGLAGGIAVGYGYIAPSIVSWLVWDAVQADMVIAYRVNNFFWLVFLTTAGIGLLADIPISMLLFHFGGIVRYRTMRERWRGVALVAFTFAGIVTPDSIYTLFVIGVPIVLAYWLGLAALWVVTLGGRRGGRTRPVETPSD